jgi:hypothetical protein
MMDLWDLSGVSNFAPSGPSNAKMDSLIRMRNNLQRDSCEVRIRMAVEGSEEVGAEACAEVAVFSE